MPLFATIGAGLNAGCRNIIAIALCTPSANVMLPVASLVVASTSDLSALSTAPSIA